MPDTLHRLFHSVLKAPLLQNYFICLTIERNDSHRGSITWQGQCANNRQSWGSNSGVKFHSIPVSPAESEKVNYLSFVSPHRLLCGWVHIFITWFSNFVSLSSFLLFLHSISLSSHHPPPFFIIYAFLFLISLKIFNITIYITLSD